MGNKFKLVLIFSLAINLLLIGMVVGYSVRGCRRQGRPPRPPERLSQQLSPQTQELFSQALRSLHEKNRQTAEAIEKKRQEVVAILVAPQFDSQAYQKATAELHALHGQMKDALTQTVMNLASQLSQEERKALAQFLLKGPPGGPPGEGGSHHHPPPPHSDRPHGGGGRPWGPPEGPGQDGFPGGPPAPPPL